jgi:hypothetical protein
MEQQQAKIEFIEICLGSFEGYEEDKEVERKRFLRKELANFEANEKLKKQLMAYMGMTKEKLEGHLERLEAALLNGK